MVLCRNGAEPKFPEDNYITIDPYEGVNVAAKAFMLKAFVPLRYDFDPFTICGSEPPDYQEISYLDLFLDTVLLNKVESNAKRAAYFKGCQCKVVEPPPKVEPPPNPPDIPPPEVDDFVKPTCQTTGSPTTDHVIGQPYHPVSGQVYNWIKWSITSPITRIYMNEVVGSYVYYAEYQQGGVGLIYQANLPLKNIEILECAPPLPPEEIPPEIPPEIPNPCEDFGCCEPQDIDCLKQVDKAEILAELKLHTSESNNRIRDEINSWTTVEVDRIKLSLKTEINQGLAIVDQNARAYRDDIKVKVDDTLTTVDNNANVRANEIKTLIQNAAGSVLAAIAANLAIVLAAIAGVTAAVAAAVTTITAAITAATTQITTLINAVKDKILEDTKKEIEKNNYKRLIVDVTVNSKPANTQITAGTNGAPDKYAVGWVQFYKNVGGKRSYGERKFITNQYNRFISEESAEDLGYVIHLLSGVVATATSQQVRFKSDD